MIGQTLSHYKIIAKLGEGGMGEVYLAEDAKLGREVALKTLPADLANSQERLERFRREARTLAAVDHPNIVHIYSVEQHQGVHFLTMQLVRGEQLSERIPARGMGLREFFDVAIPLADALSAAHEKGITHRDLKPSNVMLDDRDRVKILDFGLAKPGVAESEAGASQLPTEAVTQEGVVLGTVPYMSPEQAEGRPLDHRSDIFSLGIMLYHMSTGQAPFRGETALSVMSAIVTETPSAITELNADVPRHLGRIVRKCLEKDPGRRYQSTRDLYNDLVDLRHEVETGAVQPVRVSATPSPSRWPKMVTAVGLAVAAIGIVLVWRLMGDSDAADTQAPPSWHQSRLTSLAGVQSEPSLSPGGRRFLFVDYSGPVADIYEQRVGGTRAINLTEGSGVADYQPAYSPDGQRIAFRSERDGGGLYVMEATGENVRKVVGEGFMPAWSPGGDRLVYTANSFAHPSAVPLGPDDLRIVDLDTGETRSLGLSGLQPSWSPAGDRVAFMGYGRAGERDVGTIPAAGGEPVWVTRDAALDWSPLWSRDGRFLYFASNRGGAHNIWRVTIDERTGEVPGEPEGVTSGGTDLQGYLSITGDSRSIAYAGIRQVSNLMSAPFDRESAAVTGPPVPVTSGPRSVGIFDVSPDGEWIAFSHTSPWEDIVVMRKDGSEELKLTDDPHNDRRPRFSPDGERIYFYSNYDGSYRLWSIRADGTGRLVVTDGADGFFFSDPSPDGKMMSTNRVDGSELFSLAEAYSQQTPWKFPRDSAGRVFRPLDWSPDSRRVLGAFYRGAPIDTVAIFDRGSETYELIPEVAKEGVTFLGNDHRLAWGDPYFSSRDRESSGKLMLHDLRTGETRELLSAAPDGASSPMLSPDGTTLYYVQESASADIHLLVNESPQ